MESTTSNVWGLRDGTFYQRQEWRIAFEWMNHGNCRKREHKVQELHEIKNNWNKLVRNSKCYHIGIVHLYLGRL